MARYLNTRRTRQNVEDGWPHGRPVRSLQISGFKIQRLHANRQQVWLISRAAPILGSPTVAFTRPILSPSPRSSASGSRTPPSTWTVRTARVFVNHYTYYYRIIKYIIIIIIIIN